MGVLKRIISQHAFNRDAVGTTQAEYTRPIVMPAGKDSLAHIGAPPGLEGSSDRQRLNDAWTRIFEERFPPSDQKGDSRAQKKHVVDSETYAEETVDSMRAQKLKELAQRSARLKAEAAAAAHGAAAAQQLAAGGR